MIGLKLWSIGKRYGYVTQIQFFRGRFDSNGLGYLLFPILVILVIPYLLIGVIGAAKTIMGITGPVEGPPYQVISTVVPVVETRMRTPSAECL